MTRLQTLPDAGPPGAATRDAAIALLARGEIVGLPTETVYGLAVRADDSDALARLVALKGSDPSRPFTLHVGSAERVAASAELGRLVQRLGARYWPGPLTLVLRSTADAGDPELGAALGLLASDGWTGVRAPAHDATAAILAAAPFPVVMTSANRAGAPPALEVGSIESDFSAQEVPLILDGGPSTLGQASTVLAVGRGRFEVLRQGIVELDELRQTAGVSLLFVCTGNTCRSPMAEALARAALRAALGTEDETSFGFRVASAGVYAGAGAPVSPNAVLALKPRGLDLSGHRSQPAIDRDVARYDHVYCLTKSHQSALLGALPPGAGKHVELLDPVGGDVPDPFGGSPALYRETSDVLEQMIAGRLSAWV